MKIVGLVVAGALGAAVVVLPAVAGSETVPSITAENVGTAHYWRPPEAKVEPGGSVEFSNSTEVPHGIHWVSTPAGATPECTSGVPVGTGISNSGTKWSGTCKFGAAGTYSFYCTVHGPSMSGTITVGSPSTTTGTTTTTTTTPTTTTTTTSTGSTTAPTSGPGGGGGAVPATALSALKLGSAKHGSAVHGSLTVSKAAAGGTLAIVLQAKLGGRRVTIGRLTRAYVSSGAQSWSIALSAKARRALRAKGRLVVTAKLSLTPPGGAATSTTRTITLHR